MQEEVVPEDSLLFACPKCGTRLMRGKLIIGCVLQCIKCKRTWLVEMDANTSRVAVEKTRPAQGMNRRL